MVTSILSILLAVFKAIPVAKEFFDELVTMYVAAKLASMKQENRDAIRKAIDEQDQRPIEEAIGSSHAGEHSGSLDTVVVDDLPNVRMHNEGRD